jgi:CDP-paratose 2-epimerase
VTEHFPAGERGRVEGSMKALALLGVRHVRLEVAWADWHEASLRQWYQWLMTALSGPFVVLPALVYVPPSAARAAGALGDPKAFADFVDTLVDDFGGALEWLELPSEPAHPGLWDWRLDPRGHVFSQIVASAAYRCKQREIKTVLGGLRAGDLAWLSLMCENGVVDFADAIGLREDPAAPGRLQGWPQAVHDMKRILTEHCRNPPLWITGAGCATDNYDEFAQCEAFVGLLNADAPRVYWSGLQDRPASSGCEARYVGHQTSDVTSFATAARSPKYTGLLKSDGTPKLLYRLWQTQGIEGVRQMTGYISGRGAQGGRRLTPRAWVPQRDAARFVAPAIRGRPRPAGRGPVLITGGAGFIGSNLAERFLKAGRPVRILDNLSRPGVEHHLRYLCDTYGDLVAVHVGDVRNPGLVDEVAARCRSIFHLAAQGAVTTSLADPLGDFESNLQGTLNVLEAARKQDPPPVLLFTSTNKVYGDLQDVALVPIGSRHVPRDHGTRTWGISESRPLDFHSPHGCSKGAADQYVLDYARMYGLPGVVFRLSCIYGRRQLGTQDQGWLAHFALQMLRDEPLTLYGDGRQVRDVLYIDDLLDAMQAALDNLPIVAGKAFNLGGGPDNAVSLLEVIAQLAELSGVQPQIRYGPRRRGDQPYYVSDIRRFCEATGWTPRVSVRRGVPQLYQWLLENVQLPVGQPKE